MAKIVACSRCGHVTSSNVFMTHVCPGPHSDPSHVYMPEYEYMRGATEEEARWFEHDMELKWPSRKP